MGNAIRKCFQGECGDDSSQSSYILQIGLDSEIIYPKVTGFFRLQDDLHVFQLTSQVPEGLSQHVTQTKQKQAKWYRQILAAWDESNTSPNEASNLIARNLHVERDTLEVFLQFYNLPLPEFPFETSTPSNWPEGVEFEIYTLPVNRNSIGDGDGMTVYVDMENMREYVPRVIQKAATERRYARAAGNHPKADALGKIINNNKEGYRMINGPIKDEILVKKFKIRLRGVDAPEMKMDYGQKAKDALIKLIQNKPLQIQIYGKDRYGRWVGDAYCNGVFIQEKLLRSGCAWHHIIYDQRPEFAQWQKEAKNEGRGLWANPNPIEPWVWKRKNNNGRKTIKRKCKKKNEGAPIQVC